jgi:DNA-binding CsgD family transcriptional regulator
MPQGSGLAALPGFLDLLSSGPHPDEVAAALARGPLQPYAPATTFIAVSVEANLCGIGTYGFPRDFHARYQVFPIEYDWPASRAVTRNEVVDVSVRDIFDHYPTLAIDRELWQPIFANLDGNAGRLVAVPITVQGCVDGVYGFISLVDGDLGLSDANFLLGTAKAVGLWLRTIKESPQGWTANGHQTGELPLVLHERQQRILRLVEEGRSNSAIARMLAVSVSTVKLDLNRAMRMLRTSDRRASAQLARELGLLDQQTPAIPS